MIYTCYYDSPVGKLLLAEKDDALAGLWIEGQKYFLGSIQEETKEKADSAVFNHAKEWLNRYFDGEKPPVSELKLSPMGSEFRKVVWNALCKIPYGKITTYGTITKKLAASHGISEKAAQAVGGAVAHNPISIIIPCHRVVGVKGNLTGYAGGLDRKVWLLAHEGVDLDEAKWYENDCDS